jgi:hypothetical protein
MVVLLRVLDLFWKLAHVIRETEKYYHLHVQAAEPREMTV